LDTATQRTGIAPTYQRKSGGLAPLEGSQVSNSAVNEKEVIKNGRYSHRKSDITYLFAIISTLTDQAVKF
jgi:hypothetical protein